jgi:hypothetical protein
MLIDAQAHATSMRRAEHRAVGSGIDVGGSTRHTLAMRGISMCVAGLVLICGVVHAAPQVPTDCSKTAIRKARAEADKVMRTKQYPKAIALLEPLVRDCTMDVPLIDRAWLAGDLAVAYERNGQYLECERLMGPLSHPRSGLQESGNEKLVKAIEYNLDRCSKAFDARYAAIKPGGCTLAIDGAIATAAAPPALVPKGAAAACVALVPGKRAAKTADDDPEVRDVVCPVVAMVWKGAKAKLERKELTSDGAGALGDDSFCCALSSIAVGTMAGKSLVRVRGEGRECSGGTADAASDTFYEWNGTALIQAIDASVVFH